MKLDRQLLVSCFLTTGLLFATAPHALAHPAPDTRSNPEDTNPAHRRAGNNADTPADPSSNHQANPPAGSQAGPPAHSQANSSAASQANPPASQANAPASQKPPAERGNLLAASQASPTAEATPSRDNRQATPANSQASQARQASQSNSNTAEVESAQPGQGAGDQGQGQGEGGGATADPAGNNGTVKVDMNGDTTTRNNEPQGDCQGVTSKLFNFDGGEAITITFSGQAPTEFTTLATPIVIADADGDQSTSFSLAQVVPSGTMPARNGGYHVRIEADGQNHPAGIKTKVFWLRCDTFDLVGSEGATATPTPTPAKVGGVLIERSAGSNVAGRQQARLAESAAAAGVNRASRARVLGTTVERAALAHTGLDAMHLVTLGGLALFAGYAALRVSRRNPEPAAGPNA